MVMGGDSISKGCEFESQHCILDGHFFTFLFVVKKKFLFENMKIKKKEAGVGPFLRIIFKGCRHSSVDSSAPAIITLQI